MRSTWGRWLPGERRHQALEDRMQALEKDVAELRELSLRLAEITDVVEELLVPLASRDQERIDAAVARFARAL